MKANKRLANYLNNHLAASVGALELLATLQAGDDDPAVTRLATELHGEIKAEQQTVEKLMERLEVGQNLPSQAAGWMAEKLMQVKLRLDDANDGALRRLEALELILVGIEGKRALWRALAVAAVPGLPISEYEQYAQDSEDQKRRVETMRLDAAKDAFTS